MLEFRHLRYFVAVAEELNFGRAARALGISQPPLSRAIRALEAELGVRLLERSRRRASLTAAGRVFEKEAQKILVDLERSTSFMRENHGAPRRIAIGYVRSANIRVLPRILKEFCRERPEVEVSLHPLSTEEQIQALRDSRIDVGVLYLPARADGLTVRPLVEETSVLALPRRAPFSRLESVPTSSLHRLRLFQVGPRHAKAMMEVVPAGGCPKLTLVTGDVHEALGVVAAGMGASCVPESMVDVRRKGVIYRRPHPELPPFRIGLAYRKGKRTIEQSAFVRAARGVFDTT